MKASEYIFLKVVSYRNAESGSLHEIHDSGKF